MKLEDVSRIRWVGTEIFAEQLLSLSSSKLRILSNSSSPKVSRRKSVIALMRVALIVSEISKLLRQVLLFFIEITK